MSRNFAGTPFFNYRSPSGGPQTPALNTSTPFLVQDTNLCMPATKPSRIIGLVVNWIGYGAPTLPNIGIEVSLPSQASDKLGKIGSIYIDNTNSSVPIYINFPDTGFCVTAPPSTSVWYPVFTNVFRFQIICLNIASGFEPLTKIFISNREIGPSVDNEFFNVVPQYIGSRLIQRSNTIASGFGAPALGDQCACAISAVTGTNTFGSLGMQFPATSTIILPVTTPNTDFYYITAIQITLSELSAVLSAAGGILNMIGSFADQNTATAIVRYNAAIALAGSAQPQVFNVPLVNLTGLNLRIPGSAFYGLLVGEALGTTPPFSVNTGTITSVRYRMMVNIVYSQGP